MNNHIVVFTLYHNTVGFLLALKGSLLVDEFVRVWVAITQRPVEAREQICRDSSLLPHPPGS